MAIQAVLGIPVLAGVIGSLFTSLFTFAAQYFTKRLALLSAGLILISSVVGAFYAAIMALAVSISVAVPVEISAAAGFFVPDNAVGVVSAVMASKVLRYAYDWNVRVIQYKFNL